MKGCRGRGLLCRIPCEGDEEGGRECKVKGAWCASLYLALVALAACSGGAHSSSATGNVEQKHAFLSFTSKFEGYRHCSSQSTHLGFPGMFVSGKKELAANLDSLPPFSQQAHH